MIIVGFTGVAIYSIPNFYTAYGLRLSRYVFIILAFMNGYLGLSLAVFLFFITLANTRSFGTDLLPSFWLSKEDNIIKEIFNMPVWKKEKRSYTTHAKDEYSQPHISRRWLKIAKK